MTLKTEKNAPRPMIVAPGPGLAIVGVGVLTPASVGVAVATAADGVAVGPDTVITCVQELVLTPSRLSVKTADALNVPPLV